MPPQQSLLFLKKIALVFILTAIIVVGISTVYRAALGEKSRTDLTVYLRAAEAIHQNENIYAVENVRHWHYVYLPLLAILLTPFTSFPLWLNALLWYLLSITALWGVWRKANTLFQNQNNRFWILFVCLLVALPPLLNTLTRGQLGIFSLYLTLLPFILNMHGKKLSAGFVLGFAIILKMSPLLLLPFYFLLQKNWRALTGCALGIIVFGLALPTAVFGPELHFRYLQNYFDAISSGTGSLAHQSYLWGELFTPFAGDNQSFYAVLTRLYWKTENAFIGNSNNFIRLINLGLLGALLSALAFLFFKSKEKGLKDNFVVYALLSCVMLFTSPVSQLHHFTPLMLLGIASFLILEESAASKKTMLGILTLSFFVFALGMIFDPLAFIGLPLWSTLLLWLAIFFSKKNSQESARL